MVLLLLMSGDILGTTTVTHGRGKPTWEQRQTPQPVKRQVTHSAPLAPVQGMYLEERMVPHVLTNDRSGFQIRTLFIL